ncbi:MAG: type II secretion system minor pseudopilin GspK [Geobacteraceae bacterium]|nr:type II secretion system minor pseudopilin GspK [Geobacteraceae bacterium]
MKRGNSGFALVITLIVTALLVALVVEFISEVYVETSSKQSFVDAQKASLMAESGVSGGVALMQFTLPQVSYTSLNDIWAKPMDLPEEQGVLRVTIEDESAKLSLNHISGANGRFNDETDPTGSYYGTAMRLFRQLKLPATDLCDAVADWVDVNDIPKPGGAESQWYLQRKPAMNAKNARLDTFEELALLKGFTAEVIEKIRPFVTIYAENDVNAFININTAPKELLMALDERINESQAEQIIEYRKSTPFKIPSDLGNVTGMERIATGLSLRVTVKSRVFKIKGAAQVNGTTKVVETVVSFAGGSPQTLYWREY